MCAEASLRGFQGDVVVLAGDGPLIRASTIETMIRRHRDAAAAATQAGWTDCYNVLEGFEGDRDPQQHRGTLNGWRKAGLPWVQG